MNYPEISDSSETHQVENMSDSPSTSFVLTCPGCHKRFLLKSNSMLGKRATCKSCGAPFVIDGTVLAQCEPDQELPIKQIEVQPQLTDEHKPAWVMAPPPTQEPVEWFTAKSLSICAVIALLVISSGPVIAYLVHSGPAPAAKMFNTPIVAPESEMAVAEQPEQMAEQLDLSEEFLIRFMQTQGREFQFIGGHDKKRVFEDTESHIFLVLQGNAENLSVVTVMVRVNDLDHGDGTADNAIVNAYLKSIKLVVMATRPSLAMEIAKWADTGMVSAMLNKEASVKHGGLAFVMACEIKEKHNSFVAFNMFADQKL